VADVEMTILEALMLISSAIALPVIAVLTYAFFSGGLTGTEDAKFTVLMENDEDYWSTGPVGVAGGGARQ
jgi:Sec-independent protein secretion pathway component TatC